MWFDYSSTPLLVQGVLDFATTAGCMVARCHAYIETHTVWGPTQEEYASNVTLIVPDGVLVEPLTSSLGDTLPEAGTLSNVPAEETIAQNNAATVTSPNYVVSPNGDVVPIPDGATGPSLTQNLKGFQYNGGSGGSGLDPRVTDVRIMDTTPRYPNGYVSYSNASGQAVNPFTGQTVARSDSWWHIPLKGDQ